MEKQRIWCPEQNNCSNCPLLPGGVLPHTLCLSKKWCHYGNIIIFVLNNTYSLSTGPTVLISYTTVMFNKTTNLKKNNRAENETVYCEIGFLFGASHWWCDHKLHGENFYITLVNVVHSYNKNWSWLYLLFFKQ